MFARKSAGLTALVLISVACAGPCQATAQKEQAPTSKTEKTGASKAKSSAHKRHHSRHARAIRHGKSYLVPPPPPYSPSILPELMYARTHGARKQKIEQNQDSEKTAENNNAKTIWSREGYEDPEPVQPNKYVTYWNKN